MEERINQALAQLESDLQDISSARKQVEDTVRSSLELQQHVERYVASVQDFVRSVHIWISNMGTTQTDISRSLDEAIKRFNNSCGTVLNNIRTTLNNISESFNNKTVSILDRFSEKITTLGEHVNKLESLKAEISEATKEIGRIKATLETILQELQESQQEQDKILLEIKTSVNSIIPTVNVYKDEINHSITEFESKCINRFETIDSVLHDNANHLTSLITTCNTIQTSITSINSILQSHTSELTHIKTSSDSIHTVVIDTQYTLSELKIKVETMEVKLKESSIINRWIIIGGIVLLAVLQYLFK